MTRSPIELVWTAKKNLSARRVKILVYMCIAHIIYAGGDVEVDQGPSRVSVMLVPNDRMSYFLFNFLMSERIIHHILPKIVPFSQTFI